LCGLPFAAQSPRRGNGLGLCAGGNLGEWFAPDLISNPHVGLSAASAQDIANYLQTGSDGIAVATGTMAEAVEHSTQYFSKADALAVGTYLKSLPASATQPGLAHNPSTPRRCRRRRWPTR
jgi:hypothetical protein